VTTLFGSIALSFASAHSQAESWTKIETPDEVRQLIVNKVLDGKYWKFYFRSDGIMAYEQDGFTAFREWKINTDGEICMNIYGMPEKNLGCDIFYQTNETPVKYRLEIRGEKLIVQIVEPDETIVDAVLKKAGKVE
jgi:hypothetical protein